MMSALHQSRVAPRARRAARAGASPLGAALIAGLIGLALVLFGPPGGDAAAHLYLTQAWRDHGWQLWDNFWYSGRYAQVNYSLLFYPLAALLHPVTVVARVVRRRRRRPSRPSCAAAGRPSPPAPRSPSRCSCRSPWWPGPTPSCSGWPSPSATLVALRGRRAAALAFAGVLLTALAHPLALAFLLVVLAAIAASDPGLVALAAQPGAGRRSRRGRRGAGRCCCAASPPTGPVPLRPEGRAGDRRLLHRRAAADARAARPAPPAGRLPRLRDARGARVRASRRRSAATRCA